MGGGQCDLCQLNLFTNIQQGKFEFHPKEWSSVSGPAKDLIRRLLVKDAKKRLSARDVLNHEWLDNNNQTSLSTPAKIRKLTRPSNCRLLASRLLQSIEWCCSTCLST